MPINVKALVGLAFDVARTLVPTALPECTLRLGPTTTVDAVTEGNVTTWLFVGTIRPVAYKAESERENAPAEAILKSFAVEAGDLPPGLPLDQTAEIVEVGTTWHVYRTDSDPTGNLTIFHARRT